MKTFSPEERIDALVRRRIKFVVEKAAVARFFLGGTGRDLQEELFKALRPSCLAGIRTRDEYDQWLVELIESERWAPYSRNGLPVDRWAYFAKVINIVTYETRPWLTSPFVMCLEHMAALAPLARLTRAERRGSASPRGSHTVYCRCTRAGVAP